MMLKPLSITSRDGTGAIACAVLACLLLLGGIRAEAQVSAGGTPPTFSATASFAAAPTLLMPPLDNDSLSRLFGGASIELLRRGITSCAQFGDELLVDFGPGTAGVWDTVSLSGEPGRLWRCGVASPGATSLSFILDTFELPPGGRLWLYNPERTMVLGAFTAANNKPHRRLSTNLITDDSVIFEYFEPLTAEGHGRISVEQVVHGFQSIQSQTIQAFDSTGINRGHASCQIDVICPEGDDWCRERRGVCLVIGGGSGCTGTLLTNTDVLDAPWDADVTPYVLTAFHCIKFGDIDPGGSLDVPCLSCVSASQTPECYADLTQAEMDAADDYLFLFGFYSPTCNGGPPYVSGLPSFNGCAIRAYENTTDMALLELDDQPGSEHGVFYAGWSRAETPTTVSSGNHYVGLHHPGLSEMKISRTGATPAIVDWEICPTADTVTASSNSHLEVHWDDGTTEQGSSGSALFDPNHRVVGQLSGNPRLPYNPAHTPTDNDLCVLYPYSAYARLYLSWNGSSSGERLKDWLDPGNVGTTTTDGIYVPLYYYDLVVDSATTIAHRVFNTIEIAGKRPATGWYDSAEFRIKRGGNYTVQSPRRITIRTGFRAVPGSRFHAYIDEVDCDDVGILYRGHPRYQWSGGGSGKQVALGEEPGGTGSASEQVWLSTASPNPFNGATRIAFTVPSSGNVSLVVYDRNGRQVDLLIDAEERATGQYTIDYAPRHLPAGTYFYVYTCGERTETRQLVVIR